jgi:hypothetical protein
VNDVSSTHKDLLRCAISYQRTISLHSQLGSDTMNLLLINLMTTLYVSSHEPSSKSSGYFKKIPNSRAPKAATNNPVSKQSDAGSAIPKLKKAILKQVRR